ncbi:hypothetical protein [Intestinimonas sp. HCP28S3_D6]|uniref:hypothetical protein n=1 Tax=Intestinimonas sp. HCP28S3_D6 TaxID=3438942 RepID=UPI003F890D66
MSIRSRLTTLRTGLARIHPVDKSLLLFMALLLLQSAYTIFFPSEADPAVSDIDVIIRTSSAAIFGYFLSANFVNRSSVQTETVSAPSPLTITAQAEAETGVPKNQIGFTAGDATMESGGTQSVPSPSLPAWLPDTSCLQVATATVIGLFCLLVLLILRNMGAAGGQLLASDSVSATVVQFRDFVSGCVGFLIGFPTHANNRTSI